MSQTLLILTYLWFNILNGQDQKLPRSDVIFQIESRQNISHCLSLDLNDDAQVQTCSDATQQKWTLQLTGETHLSLPTFLLVNERDILCLSIGVGTVEVANCSSNDLGSKKWYPINPY